MNIIIDLDLQQVVQGFGSKQPAPAITVKSQDTPTLSIYFAKGNVNYDLGTSPGIRFGVFGTGPNALVSYSTFNRVLDAQSRVTYVGYPNFNTTQMLAAIGTQASITCIGEIRYQTSFGTIARTLDIAFTVERSLLSETTLDTTIAAFTTPAVNANVTVRINSTSWLSTGLNLAIAAGAGLYQVVSITNTTDFVAQNMGGVGNAASGTVIPSGTNVGIAATNVIQTYPDASLLELITRKNAVNGYAGLNAGSKLNPAAIPVDNTTINLSGAGNLQFASIAASVAANFTTPASGGTVNVTVSSSSAFVVGQWVRIPIAGYYSVTAVPDGTHVTLQNLGDLWNAGSGTTITSGAAILPWTSLGGTGGGGPGQNAFSTTSTNFTVPAVSATVPVTMASTAWLGGAGYTVFIAGAGYYAVSSITSATQAVLTNLGYLATNAASGTVINSGAMVTPGGIAGPSSTGTPGANAYDATSASFTMPAVAANVNVAIGNTAWITVGQVVVIAGAGSFQVASMVSPTVFSATALNYPGNATVGATIASGSHVSPGGLIGPAGAGGAGLNAFTTLSANFIQPAASATVSINVGTTAWMVPTQAIYIAGGGYYTVSSVTDINHAVLTNLGYSANAAPGATVPSGGGVVPSGLNGQAGTNAFTVTAANFTMPTSGSTVTVTVGATGWMAQGQNLFIPTAGYLSVSVVTDATHVVLINSGTTGNASSGTVITSGAQVSPAGSIGPIGATGPTGPAGSGGSGGIILPSAGIQDFDDFVSDYNSERRFKLGWVPQFSGGTTAAANILTPTTGCDATNKGHGVVALHLTASTQIVYLSLTTSAFAPMMFVPALGVLDIRFRIWIPSGETSGAYSIKKIGIFLVTSGATNTNNGLFFLCRIGNSANWQYETQAAGVATINTSSVAVTFGAWHTAQILTDAAWANISFYMDGAFLGTNTTNIPTVLCAPGIGSEGLTGVPQDLLCDYCYYNYTFTR